MNLKNLRIIFYFQFCFAANAVNSTTKTIDPAHQQRISNREARRSRRRQRRYESTVNIASEHYDGMSSDDDENSEDEIRFKQNRSTTCSICEYSSRELNFLFEKNPYLIFI
jgi:hypothetical protein